MRSQVSLAVGSFIYYNINVDHAAFAASFPEENRLRLAGSTIAFNLMKMAC